MKKCEDDQYCIACGDKNPIGMKLKFELKKDYIEAFYSFPKEFQGYADIVHGGMIALLLDEIMVNLPLRKLNVPVVSGEIKVKFRKPLKILEKVKARVYMVKQKSRVFIVRGEVIRESDKALIAESEAICVKGR